MPPKKPAPLPDTLDTIEAVPETFPVEPAPVVAAPEPDPNELVEPPVWIVDESRHVMHGGRMTLLSKGSGYQEERYGASTIRRWIASGLKMHRQTRGEAGL